jgi:hypothetical protein
MTNAATTPAPATMNRTHAAAYLSVAESTMERWWANDVGPRGIKLGTDRRARVFYSRAELDRFVAEGMPLRPGTARPKGVPRGCFEPPARGRPRRDLHRINPRATPA